MSAGQDILLGQIRSEMCLKRDFPLIAGGRWVRSWVGRQGQRHEIDGDKMAKADPVRAGKTLSITSRNGATKGALL